MAPWSWMRSPCGFLFTNAKLDKFGPALGTGPPLPPDVTA